MFSVAGSFKSFLKNVQHRDCFPSNCFARIVCSQGFDGEETPSEGSSNTASGNVALGAGSRAFWAWRVRREYLGTEGKEALAWY